MKRTACLITVSICVVALWLAGCTTVDQQVSPAFQQKSPDRIAVVDVTGDIRGDANKNQVEDYFVQELMGKGYRVIERSRVDKLLDEQDFQRSDRTSTDEASRIGEVVNVPAVAMVDVNVDGEKLSITARMLDVESGEILWVGNSRGGSGKTLSTIAGAAAGGVAGSEVGSGSGRTAASIAGGALGGAAGKTMAPQTARVVEKSIQRMVEELPQAK